MLVFKKYRIAIDTFNLVCVSLISIIQKQNTAETWKLVFYICIMYRCYLKLFIKIGQKLCVQGHTKEFLYITAYGLFFMLVSFRILRLHKYNEIHIYFCCGQKQVNYRIWNELFAWLIYRAIQNNSDMWVTMFGNCWSFIFCYFTEFLNKLNSKILYNILLFTSNAQGNPKSIKFVPFYLGFGPKISEYFERKLLKNLRV